MCSTFLCAQHFCLRTTTLRRAKPPRGSAPCAHPPSATHATNGSCAPAQVAAQCLCGCSLLECIPVVCGESHGERKCAQPGTGSVHYIWLRRFASCISLCAHQHCGIAKATHLGVGSVHYGPEGRHCVVSLPNALSQAPGADARQRQRQQCYARFERSARRDRTPHAAARRPEVLAVVLAAADELQLDACRPRL
jgi:hypothetical protein